MTIRRAYADSRDGQIHYRYSGPEGVPVIGFFHQTASSGVMFEKVMLALSADYRCYAFDSPGFGQSYQPEDIPNISYMTDRLVEAFEDIGMPPFHACGHHTGGCAALEIPARHPGKLLSLSLIGPVLVNDQEKEEYKKVFVRPFAVEESGAFLQTAWDYLRSIGAGANVELHRREMADHLIAHNTMPMAFSSVWEQDVAGFYEKVDVPLMIMCAREDVLWPLFERAKQTRPDAMAIEVGGADFQPDLDPGGVAEGLRKFLASL